MIEVLVVIAFFIGIWIYKSSKKSKYPHRLFEIQNALETRAALFLHRGKNSEASQKLALMAEDLKLSQFLLNDSSDAVLKSWPRLRPQMMHLTSEAALNQIDLYYTDRRDELKDAVFDLIERLDRMESRARDGKTR